jgi:hypothetical protein
MGQYKVPQDVEAEDKLVGFLTLKQFIYVVIGLAWGFVSYRLLSPLPFIFLIVGVPPTLIFLMLGLIQRQGQPFETYFVAMVSFYFKPRKRLWHKDPILEVFKLEQPKIVEDQNQRSTEEVRSKLDQIAQIVDTRGWAAKEPEIQEPEASHVIDMADRLAIPQTATAPTTPTIEAKEDMLDMQNNPQASGLNVLMQNAVKNIRAEALTKMKSAPKTPSTSSGNKSGGGSTSEMTANPVAGILKLAMENDDLTVSQLAAQAQKHVALSEGQAVSLRKPNRKMIT